jgi:putative membrane protein insertion efficiency factor
MSDWIRRVFTAPIVFYRRFLSPLKPPMCRFEPTCSGYALQAIRERGILVGCTLTLWRLLRCQPFCKGGHDPVPARGFKPTEEDRERDLAARA